MKLQLERKNLKVEIIHLLYEDGRTKVILQDDYGFDTGRIFKELGL